MEAPTEMLKYRRLLLLKN